jgi:hypothetical protein
LPAAGIVLLSRLAQRKSNDMWESRGRVLQDLGVLAAEIRIGTWVRSDEPNNALLQTASQTIQSFLDSVYSDEPSEAMRSATGDQQESNVSDWAPVPSLGSWDFEIGFWESLAEHPPLYQAGSPM